LHVVAARPGNDEGPPAAGEDVSVTAAAENRAAPLPPITVSSPAPVAMTLAPPPPK